MAENLNLENYTIEKVLGRGATAQVYLATRKNDGTRVALKVFHSGLWDQKLMQSRAMGEVTIAARLKHPNIVQVFESHWDRDPPIIALEYIDGFTLEDYQPRLPYIFPEVSVSIILKILEGLTLAHSHGIIHRDLKPGNILIGSDGRITIADFGLAKVIDFSKVTLSGSILGSPDFMSPEQARGETVDARSDLFSVGSLLYFLVTGTKPFSRNTPLATLAAVTSQEAEPPQRRNPKLSLELATLILKSIEKKAEKRFQNAKEFTEALKNYLLSIGLADENRFSFLIWSKAPTESTFESLRTISDHLHSRIEGLFASPEKISDKKESVLKLISHLSQVAPESASIQKYLELLETPQNSQRKLIPLVFLLLFLTFGISGFFYFSKTLTKPAPQLADLKPIAQALESKTLPSSSATLAPTRLEEHSKSEPLSTPSQKNEEFQPKIAKTSDSTPKSTFSRPLFQKNKPINPGVVQFDVGDGIQVIWDGVKINPKKSLSNVKIGNHTLTLIMNGRPPMTNAIDVKAEEPTVIRVH